MLRWRKKLIRTKDVQREADEPVMSRERQQYAVDQDDVLEVVENTLAVEKVHGNAQEIPVESFRKAQTSCFARHVYDADDLLKGHYLDGCDDHDDVDMTSEQGSQEHSNHDKGPYCPSDEGLFLLFEF